MEEKVREIGKKARRRLEEERRKRKEIIRLDNVAGQSTIAVAGRTSGTTFSKAIKQISVGNKQRRPSKKRRKNLTTQRPVDDEGGVDNWIPSTGGLCYLDLPKTEKSNIIRLHGLPVGIGAKEILTFFGGLSPECVFILPSLNVLIAGFDAKSEESKGRKGFVVERSCTTFRVFVRFHQSSTADVAVKRSGEILIFFHDGARKGAAIGISRVTKDVALQIKDMAIKCPKGPSLDDVLITSERQMPRATAEIMWIKACANLQLEVNLNIFGTGIDIKDILNVFPLPNKRVRRDVVKLHTAMLNVYETLQQSCTPLQLKGVSIDPSLTSATQHLTNSAARWLLNEMEKIEKLINAANGLLKTH